jgi:hypothetical protein
MKTFLPEWPPSTRPFAHGNRSMLAPSDLAKRRAQHAQKIARYRRRRRLGLSVYRIELRDADVVRVLRCLTETKQEAEQRLARLFRGLGGSTAATC